MSEQLTMKQQKENTEQIRDLFARAHDYIAQANHPGHLGMKVAEVLNFLAFQYNDFKTRAEALAKQLESEAKAELSQINVDSVKATVEQVLEGQAQAFDKVTAQDAQVVTPEAPEAL